MSVLLALAVVVGLHQAASGDAGGGALHCRDLSRAPTRTFCDSPDYLKLITPYVENDSFPAPADEKAWRAGMALFVRCIAARLQSSDPCVWRAALILLEKIADAQAVEPLLARLEDPSAPAEVREHVLWVLAQTFRSPLVLPHVLRAFQDGEYLERAIGLATVGAVDERVLDELLELGEREPTRPHDSRFVGALGHQSRARPDDPRLERLFWQAMSTPGGGWSAEELAEVVCDAGDFERLAAAYLDGHADDCGNSWLLRFLRRLGGEGTPRFLERSIARATDPYCRRVYADMLVEHRCGRADGVAFDPEAALRCLKTVPSALPHMSSRSLWKVISEADLLVLLAMKRAAFWEQAEQLWRDNPERSGGSRARSVGLGGAANPDLAQSAACRLGYALDLDGTGELDKALAALERCFSHDDSGGPGGRQSNKEKLERLRRMIANRQIAESVRLVGAGRTPAGSAQLGFVATLLGPDRTVEHLLAQSPLAYVDLYRDGAWTATCEATVRPMPPSGEGRTLVLVPIDTACVAEGATAMRARLLFPGLTEEVFRGALDTGVVACGPTAEPPPLRSPASR